MKSRADIRIIKHNVDWKKAHDECVYQGGTLADTKDIDSACASMSDVRIWLGEEERVKKIARYEKTSMQSTLASSMNSLYDSSSEFYGYVSTAEQQQSSLVNKSSSSVSKNGSSRLQTTVTSDLSTKSMITTPIVLASYNVQMPTTLYGLVATITNTEELSKINMLNTIKMESSSSRSHKNSAGRTSLQSTSVLSLTSFLESSSSSTDEQHKSTVKTNMFRESSSSVSIHEPSNVGSSILPTSAMSDLFNDHATKSVPSISVITSTLSTTTKNLQMPTTVYGSFTTRTNKEELSKTNNMPSTTTMKSNNSGSKQNSTGLIVGISVSILVVLLIGVFGICRLRDQCPSKQKTDDYTIPSTDTKDPNYDDINFDLNKNTHVIENDSTQPMVATKGADKQFLPTDNISNGKTNISNNAYAVVVKIPSFTNTSKAETNEDKNETKEISMDENDYDMLNKPRPVSGNASSNVYDTSGERLDENDPTYNTTAHMQTKERELESNYDHV
ncbi:serine-rich adhesin for platelets-like [Mytilus trossulus]|uniref:serine-rich adhesin for platelets-like n=1 Tax=Mytilus trossulus TaxID=6551 RepID=UPI003005A5C5